MINVIDGTNGLTWLWFSEQDIVYSSSKFINLKAQEKLWYINLWVRYNGIWHKVYIGWLLDEQNSKVFIKFD